MTNVGVASQFLERSGVSQFIVFSAIYFLTLFSTASLAAGKPPVPPGRDPGGVAIAIIGAGVDYTVPEVAARLARDGEGEIIGWDFIDDDRRPYQSPPAVLPGAELIAGSSAGARICVARVVPVNREMTARAIGWAARSPARIAFILGGAPDPALLEAAARQFPDLLFVVTAAGAAVPVEAPPPEPENVITVTMEGAWSAVTAIARQAAMILAAEPALPAAALKANILAASPR